MGAMCNKPKEEESRGGGTDTGQVKIGKIIVGE